MKNILLLGYLVSIFAYEIDDSAIKIIRQEVQRNLKTEENTVCTITETEPCNIDDMEQDISYLVAPGGSTRCIFESSTPFRFQVVPGDADKVLFYFQGGGACWDESSTTLGFCTTDANPQSSTGVFNRTEAKNAYKDYTIIHVLYCSGDVFGGNVTRSYNYPKINGSPVVQHGLQNAQSVLDWTKSQQDLGFLAPKLSSLAIMGCSAGSMGAQIWAVEVLKTLKFDKASVTPDSYAGVFPPGTEGPLMYDFGFCGSGLLMTADLYNTCMNQTLLFRNYVRESISSFPTIPYAFIQSKTDVVQITFYTAIAKSFDYSPAAITPSQFYVQVNEIFEEYNAEVNFVTYLVDGDQHCFTNKNIFYTADPINKDDNGESTDSMLMYTWAGSFPLSPGESRSTTCDGDSEELAQMAQANVEAVERGESGASESTSTSQRLLAVEPLNNETYCDADLVGKTFTATSGSVDDDGTVPTDDTPTDDDASNADSNSNGKKDLSSGAVAGIAIGAIFGGIACIGGLFFAYKYAHSKRGDIDSRNLL